MRDVDFSHVDGCTKEADGGWSMSLETTSTTTVFQSLMLSSITNTRFLLFFVDDEVRKSAQLSEWESETKCGFYDRRIATALVELPASFADVSVTSVGDPNSIETASYQEASDLFQEYSSCEIINMSNGFWWFAEKYMNIHGSVNQKCNRCNGFLMFFINSYVLNS